MALERSESLKNMRDCIAQNLPITSLHLVDGLLFAAEGTTLHLHRLNDAERVSSHKIFLRQPIHGITTFKLSESTVLALIWGGRAVKCIRLVSNIFHAASSDSLQDVSFNLRCVVEACISDRISHGSLRPQNDRNSLEAILVTAHGALYSLIFTDHFGWGLSHASHALNPPTSSLPGVTNPQVIRVAQEPQLIRPGARSLLFTAQLRWLSRSRLLFCAGTAFGELIVETFDFREEDDSRIAGRQRCSVDDAHDGAVFGLDASVADARRLLVVTCSDERKIKLWDATSVLDAADGDSGVVRPAGIDLLAWTWAHESRVWHVKFACRSERSEQMPRRSVIVSAGEDATVHVWQHWSHDAHSLQHVSGFTEHAGKNIWALAVDASPSGMIDIVTGGADGAVELSRFSKERFSEREESDSLLSGPISNKHGPSRIRNFCWLDGFTLLAVAPSGDIWLKLLPSSEDKLSDWLFVDRLESIGKYAVLCRLETSPIALIGTSTGDVLCFCLRSNQLNCLCHVDGKIISIVASKRRDRATPCAFLVSVLNSEHGFLCTSVDEFASVPRRTKLRFECASPVHGLELTGNGVGDLFVFVGDRAGRVVSYRMASSLNSGKVFEDELVPIENLQAHGDAVTSIRWVGNPDHTSLGYLLSTSRDSTYSLHRIDLETSPPTVTEIHRGFPPFGPLFEGAAIDSHEHLILYGFRGDSFIVHDTTTRRELVSVDCRGGHRLWSYHHAQDRVGESQVGSFAWNTGGKLMTVRAHATKHITIRPGGHGREIRACAVCPVPVHPGSSTYLIATGAEDTDIRLFEYTSQPSGIVSAPLRCVAVIRTHNTGLQHLRWSQSGHHLISSAGASELNIWRITRAPLVRIGVVREATLPLHVPDLRITSFAITHESRTSVGGIAFSLLLTLSNSSIRVSEPLPALPRYSPNVPVLHVRSQHLDPHVPRRPRQQQPHDRARAPRTAHHRDRRTSRRLADHRLSLLLLRTTNAPVDKTHPRLRHQRLAPHPFTRTTRSASINRRRRRRGRVQRGPPSIVSYGLRARCGHHGAQDPPCPRRGRDRACARLWTRRRTGHGARPRREYGARPARAAVGRFTPSRGRDVRCVRRGRAAQGAVLDRRSGRGGHGCRRAGRQRGGVSGRRGRDGSPPTDVQLRVETLVRSTQGLLNDEPCAHGCAHDKQTLDAERTQRADRVTRAHFRAHRGLQLPYTLQTTARGLLDALGRLAGAQRAAKRLAQRAVEGRGAEAHAGGGAQRAEQVRARGRDRLVVAVGVRYQADEA